MRFGELPLAEADGAILAHSIRAGELTLKKGRRLQAEDVAALRAAGVGSVIAARLGPEDVHEDEAARLIAAVASGAHLRVDRPFTGRVNLFAEEAGLVALDRARIDRLNRVDEAVTIATLPAFEPVQPKDMVATVKIIPFGAERAVVERCLAIAAESGPPVAVAPYRRLDVALIQTRLPSVKESVLDKTVAITADRVRASGGRLVSEARCAHEVGALAERIRRSNGDLLLIAGASAITDREDVLPAAIEAAGGVVEHFGMPVDPGNLLLLAHLDGRVVLGLPGCCRSPKPNGFDWVHSTDDSNKLGAIGDMHLVITKHAIDEDIIVVGGDNLFSDDLHDFGGYCLSKQAPVTGVYDVGNLEAIKKYNAIDIDALSAI